jgi:hypothetical protein
MKYFIILSLFTVNLSLSFARSPAVEPVSGLSIDKYQHTDTKNQNFKKGSYKFSSQKPAAQTFNHDATNLIVNPENGTISTYIFIAIAVLLPAGLWATVMYGLKDSSPQERRGHSSDSQNITRIHDRRGKEENDSHDSDIPKAS